MLMVCLWQKFMFFFLLPFLPKVSCLPSLLAGWVILLTHTFSSVEVLWRSWVSLANLLWQIPFFPLWIQTSWRSIFKSHVKWHLEQCKNLKQELYKDPAQRLYYNNIITLLCLLFHYFCCFMNTSQAQQRLAFTLFCLVLVLTEYVRVVTACECHINITAVMHW